MYNQKQRIQMFGKLWNAVVEKIEEGKLSGRIINDKGEETKLMALIKKKKLS